MKKFNLLHITSLILPFILSGCMPDSLTKFSKDETTSSSSSSSSSGSTSSGTGGSTSAPNLSTLTAFQLKNITQKSTTYHMHKYGSGNKSAACEIPIASIGDGATLLVDGSNDILCWLEADEVQLFYNGADFQLNAPAGYCEYIQIKPYYFWNAPPKNTIKTVESVVCAENNTTCQSLGGPKEANLTCVGDYTTSGGPNCDEGEITLISHNVSADTPENPDTVAIEFKDGIDTPKTTTKKCGGKRSNCYAGPGKDFLVNGQGIPIPTDYLAYLGQSVNYSVTAPGPLGKGYSSNHYISNYTQTFTTGPYSYDYSAINTLTGLERYSKFSSANAGSYVTTQTYNAIGDTSFASNSGEVGTDPAVFDIALDPLKGTSSTYKVQPFYEFSCLNFAHEVKARIRLQIREWNQIFQRPVASYTEVEQAAPIRLLRQSLNEDDLEDSGVGYWNDIVNWDTPFLYSADNNTANECNTGFPSRDLSGCFAPIKVGTLATAVDVYGFLFPYLGF